MLLDNFRGTGTLRDPTAIEALRVFAEMTEDDDMAVAIMKRLDAIAEEYMQLMRLSEGSAISSVNKVWGGMPA